MDSKDSLTAHFEKLDRLTLQMDSEERQRLAEEAADRDRTSRATEQAATRALERARQQRTFGGVVTIVGAAFVLIIFLLGPFPKQLFLYAIGCATILLGIARWDSGHGAINRCLSDSI